MPSPAFIVSLVIVNAITLSGVVAEPPPPDEEWSADLSESPFEFSIAEALEMDGEFCNVRFYEQGNKFFKTRQYPRRMSNDDYELYTELCPEIYQPEGVDGRSCCPSDVVDRLKTYMNTILSTIDCPSCAHNFRTVVCNKACASSQARRGIHLSGGAAQPEAGEDRVKADDGYIVLTADYWNNMLDSCKDAKIVGTPMTIRSTYCETGDFDCSHVEPGDYRTGSLLGSVTLYGLFVGNPEDEAEIENGEDLDPPTMGTDFFQGIRCGEAAPYPEDAEPCNCDECKEPSQSEGCKE